MRSSRSLVYRSFVIVFLSTLLLSCGGGGSGSDSSSGAGGDGGTTVPTAVTTAMQKGQPITDLGGAAASEALFSLEVGSDATHLFFTTSGGSGDVDLYLRFGADPTTGLYDCRSNTLDSNNETCLIDDPAAGTYYVMLYGDTAYSSVELVADYDTTAPGLAGSAAYGTIPNGMPPRLAVGLMAQKGATWMRDSAVAWDMRYHYFTKGWRDNWGWYPANNGQWGLEWMEECNAQGFIPAIQYYSMNDEPGGGEGQFYDKTTDAGTMASYFDDFKVLMKRAKEFDKPVLVMVEADGFAFLEQQTKEDANAYAAIADSGLAELSTLPNTAAGWGMAFLQLRKAVGADKVILGIHISAWASGQDISYFSTSIPLQPEVDKVYAYLAQLGLAANQTGETYDLLVGDPLDRDSDYYRLTQGQDRWWDMDDNAPIHSKSFNRYAEWMRLWNQKSGKRWVLWQIPVGNSNHLNVKNTGGSRQGYKDNRVEYFFGQGTTAHMRRFADAGAVALLFGPGMPEQAYYTNDVYSDGKLFLQSRAGAILNNGGLPVAKIGR